MGAPVPGPGATAHGLWSWRGDVRAVALRSRSSPALGGLSVRPSVRPIKTRRIFFPQTGQIQNGETTDGKGNQGQASTAPPVADSALSLEDKKIFSIHGHYPVIRALLRRKGWVEKKLHFLPKGSVNGDGEGEGEGAAESKRTDGRESQEVAFEETDDIHDVMSRLVRNEIPYFLWTIKRDSIDYHSLSGEQMLNHYGKTASFTTKIGLCLNMRNLPWYAQANPDAFFPRCYGLGSDSEKQEFLDDFRRTAAASILKWVVSHQRCPRNQAPSRPKEAQDADPGSQKAPENNSKPVGLSGQLVDMACQVCQAYLGQLEHEDIDVAKDAAKDLTEEQWKELTQQYYALIHGKAFISNPRTHFSQCQALLNKISSVSPQTEIDGLRNVWIVKPAAKSRGRDIVCMNRVEEILELVAADHLSAKDKWVVQKYIETPLLIYDTKFDIRQWFLVTDWNPLTIWFYKESYLRFSTRRFSLDDLDGAIHLCNNSIQKHLKVDKGRSPLLPYHSMWTSTRFQEYLQKRGRGSAWGSVIYPAMKQAIAHAMKVAQDHVEPRKSSFELYGADFILGHDFKPWLIEINSSPTMHASTPVTAQLCAQVQEDTIKVVLDRKGDRSCDIGNFELLWKQVRRRGAGPVPNGAGSGRAGSQWGAGPVPKRRVGSQGGRGQFPTGGGASSQQGGARRGPAAVYGSDLCVEGVGVRKGKKQMPPIPHLRFSPALLDAQPLKARCPTAMPDLAPGHLKLKYGKGAGWCRKGGCGPPPPRLPLSRLHTGPVRPLRCNRRRSAPPAPGPRGTGAGRRRGAPWVLPGHRQPRWASLCSGLSSQPGWGVLAPSWAWPGCQKEANRTLGSAGRHPVH
ncbi:hypothetical protein QTO34_012931 [Cnephaeus nilssonii]|uniref:Tubulin tyrosine ligase like 8 n=1 Tax=Cnephaeus nilssonii TaxID=3371016 RepID=A0AA40HB41_CNENI|nr:hypothetical protein QTO34_012931 [Eptesicus nilssonii]